VTSSICKRNINLKVYSLVLEVLKQSVVGKEPMPLLPFERGIQIVYIVQLKRSGRYLAKVCDCLVKLDSYNILDFFLLRHYIRLTCIMKRFSLVYLCLC
jgi:hypothetical protein